MTIAGLQSKIEMRILSKDPSGPASRLVRIPPGWGASTSGAFTADLEIFIVEGAVTMAGQLLRESDYGAVRAGDLLTGIRAEEPTVALLFNSAPLRYDRAVEGLAVRPVVGRPSTVEWDPVPELPGRFVRKIATGPGGEVWLAGAHQWSNEGGSAHHHAAAEEMFVLEGTITLTEGEGEGARTVTYEPGMYAFRPPLHVHAGPGSVSAETMVAFHRAHGTRSATWIATSATSSVSHE